MSDKEKKLSAIPGFTFLCLSIIGLVSGYRGVDEPSGEITGVLYLLIAAIVFGYILNFCYPNKK